MWLKPLGSTTVTDAMMFVFCKLPVRCIFSHLVYYIFSYANIVLPFFTTMLLQNEIIVLGLFLPLLYL
jgi:hypothetical protein